MRLPPRIRRLGWTAGRAVWLVVSRHSLSLLTVAVLAVFSFLVLSSDSFESHDPDGRVSEGPREDSPVSFAQAKPRRPSVLFYVVDDAAQRDEIASAVHADRLAFDAGVPPVDYIIYLVAGTKEEEARTIARLNFEEIAAQLGGVDMRVIDLRGRFD